MDDTSNGMKIDTNARNSKGEIADVFIFSSYLQLIRNSTGSKIFRNLFVDFGGKKTDVSRDGELSCDIYVSGVLRLFGLIDQFHATVDGCVKAMEKHGWYAIKKPRVGAVIVWGPKKFIKSGEIHKHIGFYIGAGKAMSNNSKKRYINMHSWNYGNKRGIEAILWNDKLSDSI